MSFRVQITPVTSRMLERAGVGFQTEKLVADLKNDLAEEAKKIIVKMQAYPGEPGSKDNPGPARKLYRQTGMLRYLTLYGDRLRSETSANDYIRTGQLGQSWDYKITTGFAGSLILKFENQAHDYRPRNFYAGWVNGFSAANARGRYHQTEFHRLSGWANFETELAESNIAGAAQDSINDYLKGLGLL